MPKPAAIFEVYRKKADNRYSRAVYKDRIKDWARSRAADQIGVGVLLYKMGKEEDPNTIAWAKNWLTWVSEHAPSAWMRYVASARYNAFFVDLYDPNEAVAYKLQYGEHRLVNSPELRAAKQAERERLSLTSKS